MMNEQAFSLPDVLSTLDVLGVAHSVEKTGNVGPFEPASLKKPVPNGIYFCINPSDLPEAVSDSLIFVATQDKPRNGNTYLVTTEPQLAYYKFLRHFFKETAELGIHPTAIVSPKAEIDSGASIGPYCVIEAARIETGVVLHNSITVLQNSLLKQNVKIEPYSVIGATGVVWAWDRENGERVTAPQIGHTIIGEDCFLGSDITIVRASINEATIIGRGTVIAHGSKIGHGTEMGEECHLANNVSVGGGVEIGRRSFLGSGCTLRPGVKVGSKTIVGAGSTVVGNYPEGDQVLMGIPAKPRKPASERRMAGVPNLKGM